MFYNYSQNAGYDYNECTSRGACSISPNISSLQEVMLILLRQMAYYVLKLEEMGEDMFDMKTEIIEEILMFDSAGDYSDEQFLNIFSRQYSNLIKAHRGYLKLCKEKNLTCEDLKNLIKFSPDMKLSTIIKKGEKAFWERFKRFSNDQKYLAEILLSVLKSVSNNISNYKELDKVHTDACNQVLEALNMFNSKKISADEIKDKIKKLSMINIELFKLIYQAKINSYGNLQEVNVSLSTKPGKAVLVSGSNLSDLYAVLTAAKDKNVDVYSNGNLLISHAYQAFNEFKNFKGHFGSGADSIILDFATFPGSILLTKNEAKNIEYLYRGRLFTTDKIPPKGVVQIKEDDFSELIDSAEQAKGFAKGQERSQLKIGFNSEDLDKKLDGIADKFNKKSYKHLFIIGLATYSSLQYDYFKKFFALMPKDSFVLSFSYGETNDNTLALNLGNDYSLVLNVLARLFERIPIDSEDLTFFLTKCDVNTLSNIINLKDRGAKNIFLSECPPTIVNPTVLKEFTKIFKIHNTTTARADLDTILNRKD